MAIVGKSEVKTATRPATPVASTATQLPLALEESVATLTLALNIAVDRIDRLESTVGELLAELNAAEAGLPSRATDYLPFPPPATATATATPVAIPAVDQTAYKLRERLTARYGRETNQPKYAESSLRALLGYYAEDRDGSPLQDGDSTAPHYMASLKTASPRLAKLRAMSLREYGVALWACPDVLAWLGRDAPQHGGVCRLVAMMDHRYSPDAVLSAYTA